MRNGSNLPSKRYTVARSRSATTFHTKTKNSRQKGNDVCLVGKAKVRYIGDNDFFT